MPGRGLHDERKNNTPSGRHSSNSAPALGEQRQPAHTTRAFRHDPQMGPPLTEVGLGGIRMVHIGNERREGGPGGGGGAALHLTKGRAPNSVRQAQMAMQGGGWAEYEFHRLQIELIPVMN